MGTSSAPVAGFLDDSEPQQGRPKAGHAPAKKVPRKITASYLQNAAKHHLERYAAPAAQLARVLERKVWNSCRHHGDDPASFRTMIDEVVARAVKIGLVDDKRFAENRSASLRRKGKSARMIAVRLSAKGVTREMAAATTAGLGESEHEAAIIAARRKRLGPWRKSEREAHRRMDVAALMRQGFSGAIARAVVDGEAEG
ncbi:MAG: regulatory protein RecX [Bosea sp. (in: a-proteobacteria)]